MQVFDILKVTFLYIDVGYKDYNTLYHFNNKSKSKLN